MRRKPAGVAWALLSGITYASVMLSLRGLRGENACWLMALNLLFTAAVLSPFYFASGVRPEGRQWPLLIAFGALQMGTPYILFARGVRTVPSLEAAGLVLLEPILVPLWVVLTWGEMPAWWTVVGAGLILLGLATRYLRAALATRDLSDS